MKRYTPTELWQQKSDSHEVYVHASHYDALAAKLAEALRLLKGWSVYQASDELNAETKAFLRQTHCE